MGALVRVKGLNGRPELNGLCGVVVEPRTANGRWPVHMLPSGARVALLAERLTIEAPCYPSPSKSELEAQNELVSLVTLRLATGRAAFASAHRRVGCSSVEQAMA